MLSNILYFVVVVCAIYLIRDASCEKCGKVFLTVSPLEGTFLEMNWISRCTRSEVVPDTIELFTEDPKGRENSIRPILRISSRDYENGYYRSNIKFGYAELSGKWRNKENTTRKESGPNCYPYWIASFKDNDLMYSRCLSIEPTWMNDNREVLNSVKLSKAFIPGTHNSASYTGIPGFLKDYVLCQDRSVWAQLLTGIRYLDFRVGYYDDGFFINHDFIQVTRLEPVLQQVRQFAELAPGEVIIVDFHRFPYPSNFTSDIHKNLVALVYQELGHLALQPIDETGSGPTFGEIWSKNKSLIITYADRDTANENSWLWNPLDQYWADTTKVDVLKDFISTKIQDHKETANPFWALMAQLTPTAADIFLLTNSLSELADKVNRDLNVWFRDEWPEKVNIVTSDFFLGNDLINIAIEINKQKGKKLKNN